MIEEGLNTLLHANNMTIRHASTNWQAIANSLPRIHVLETMPASKLLVNQSQNAWTGTHDMCMYWTRAQTAWNVVNISANADGEFAMVYMSQQQQLGAPWSSAPGNETSPGHHPGINKP